MDPAQRPELKKVWLVGYSDMDERFVSKFIFTDYTQAWECSCAYNWEVAEAYLWDGRFNDIHNEANACVEWR